MSLFAERLKKCRKNKGLTQKQAAEHFSVAERHWQNYESGNRTPTFEGLASIADYFGVPVDYLMGRTNKAATLTASQWLDRAEPEEKQHLYDEIKKLFSHPEVAATIYEEVQKEGGKVVEESGEGSAEIEIPIDSIGEAATKVLIQWLEEKRPEAQEFVDRMIEKIEIFPPERVVSVQYRDPKKT
jgi:transcriptional regulator with XRE-family HTH domain